MSVGRQAWRWAFCWAALLSTLAYASGPRIVAVGDVHGSLDGLQAILRQAGIIDDKGKWAGRSTVFVQTGDLLDRGPDDRAVLDFMMRLEGEAKAAGGQVVSLLGNHEVMNMIGDLRYVSPRVYASFANEKSEELRMRALRESRKLVTKRNRRQQLEQPDWEVWEADWLKNHPLGFVEHRQAFSRKGVYGEWLRKKQAVFQAGGYIFLHGGLSPRYADLSIKELNKRVKNEIRAFDGYQRHLSSQEIITAEYTLSEMMDAVQSEIQYQRKREIAARIGSGPPNLSDTRRRHQLNLKLLLSIRELGGWLSMSPNGPLWFRGYVNWEREEGQELIEKVLSAFRAQVVVVGHTPQLEGIRPRFRGRVFLIDTGLLSEFYTGGRPSALEIEPSGRISAVYLDRRVVLRHPDPGPTH